MKKKSIPTPKGLARKRVFKSKLMKLPKNEGNFDTKGNNNPVINNNTKKNTFTSNDEAKEYRRNPFVLSDSMRVFSKPLKPRTPKPEPFITEEPYGITDFDPIFFEIVEGRPFRPNTNIKVHMKSLRDLSLLKADAAYLKETIIIIDTKNRNEMATYNVIRKLYVQCKYNFTRFIKEDFKTTQTIMRRSEEKALEAAKMFETLEDLSFKYVKMRFWLVTLGSKLDTLATYAEFLTYLAPQWWKSKFGDIFDMDERVHFVDSEDLDNVSSDSESTIERYKIKTMERKKPPILFFMKPKDLIRIFNDISRQCTNYMKINDQSNPLIKLVLKRQNILRDNLDIIVADLKDYIEMYEKRIQIYRDKEAVYKETFNKILMTEFRNLFSSFNNVKLYTCVQYVHSIIYKLPEDPNDNIATLMRQLENIYYKYTAKMDGMGQEIVKKATKELFTKDKQTMKAAYLAQNILKKCDELSLSLYRSFEPPRRRRNLSKIKYT